MSDDEVSLIDRDKILFYSRFMATNKDLLQALVKGQTALQSDFNSLKSEVSSLREEMHAGFRKVNNRLDMVGKQLAYLEDDTPTRDEHSVLEERVDKLEHTVKIAS